jgi:hypothetical protein
MKCNKYFRLLVVLLMACMTIGVKAQSSGDKLFLEGQNLQRVMTIPSQKAAINKFNAAKAVYTAADKKKMCDNQIAVCNNNIKSLSKPKNKDKKGDKTSAEEKPKQEAPAAKPARTDVKLELSDNRLDFKAKPKEGATQSVKINCNYDDWVVAEVPEWLTVYTSKDKISVEASENTTEEDRSGIVVIKCEDKEANLIVNQDKAGSLKKKLDKINPFKKKK